MNEFEKIIYYKTLESPFVPRQDTINLKFIKSKKEIRIRYSIYNSINIENDIFHSFALELSNRLNLPYEEKVF